MADATPTPAPADDGRAHVNSDGTVTTSRRAFVWCQDESTGGRFDVPAQTLPRSGVRPIEGYPLNFKRQGRNGKTRAQLAGDPAETDVHGDVTDTGAPEPAVSGDEQQAANAAAAQPVEVGVPETATSGDQQQASAAAAGVDQVDGDPAAAETTRNRRTQK